ncbi:glycosyltransferase family 4 protein [Phocaeicola sartorii]|jgi:glycosyltransferase involved in cell wall biosynthesis|uniref:glycosyltransferase family 4 protein n=1 Tax=Phocaeicola sartorii TaxID=671267 RepID=UPI002587BF1B|nr:glycosyltransferase family 4 protein [Phocaeicola sartorii]
MRILFISNYSQLYGANRSMLLVIEYLKKVGHDVILILPSKGEICIELNEKGIVYHVETMFTQLFYYKPLLKYLALPLLDLQTLMKIPRLVKFAKEFTPDLIYSNTSAEMVGIKIAKQLGVTHISHIREFMDLDHGAKYLFGAKAKKRYINQSDGVIYVSNAVANHVNQGESLQPWQKVIYNGVRCCDIQFTEHKLSDTINLGVVGIFDPEKGQDMAINYFRSIIEAYPFAKLHFWGDKDGPYKKKLFNMVASLGLENKVIFHGFEKRVDIIYSEMDVLLMCSHCEGFGRVTIEAMQRGIPVLGFNSGGTTELIEDGFNGYLFSDEDEFKRKIQILLQSEDHFNKIRRNAYEDSRKKYSAETYCRNVEEFINSIMRR